MERYREVRRWKLSTANGIGLSRRRHRITSLRDSTEEGGGAELRLRDRERRLQKKDKDKSRDRELTGQFKRRRLERYTQRNNSTIKDNKGVEAGGGGGTEDSCLEESFNEDYYEDYDGKAPLSTSKLNHAFRKTTTRSSSPVLRVIDELIGVPIPRRARSVSVKRSNECWISGSRGFGEEQSHRRLLSSALSRSISALSPSCSGFPTKKKMKSVGPKTHIPKVSSEPSSSVQDNIEIEVVEALFDLMKQSQFQSSRKFERSSDNKPTEKFDSICNKAADDKSVRSHIISAKAASHISDLPQDISSFSGPLLDIDWKKKGDEDGEVEKSVEISASIVSINEIKASKQPIMLKNENSSPKLEKLLANNGVPLGLEQTRENKVDKWKDPKDQATESVSRVEVMTKEQVFVPQVKGLLENKVARFQIDLMAPPPMRSSPEREKDSLTDLVSPDVQMKSKETLAGKRHEGKQTQIIDIEQEFAGVDFEKPQKNDFTSDYDSLQQQDRNERSQCKIPLSEGKDFAQTNLLPFPIAVTCRPGGYHPGCIAPLLTTMPLDGSATLSAQLQPPPFSLVHPLPKRSATHQHIACSIRYHQQLTKNCNLPAACSPSTLHGSKTFNINPAPSVSNTILGKPLQEDLPTGQVLASKRSEVSNFVDAAKTKQLMLRPASQQSPAGNLVHRPAFILPLDQHQAACEPIIHSRPSKSAKANGKVSLSNNSAGGPPVSPSLSAVSFSSSDLPANGAPSFMAILQSNGYPFSISSNGGLPSPSKAAKDPLLPFSNASYYPSVYHVTQVQQQPSTSRSQSNCLQLVQLDSQATSILSGLSPFHKRSHAQQQIGSQTSVNCSLLQQQQSLKQHVTASPSSSKFDKLMSRQHSASFVNSQESCAKKASSGKSLTIPVQPIDVTLISHGVSDSHGDIHNLYLQQQESKCSMEVTTPQAFTLSFGSKKSCTPAPNLSSLSQNPAAFQMPLDVGKRGYQLVHAAQVAQHKNFHVAEGKCVLGAAINDYDETIGIMGKAGQLNSNPSDSSVNEIASDCSARILNVLPSACIGKQLSGSSSTALTAVFSVNPPHCHPQLQQQELIELPKQRIQQMQMTGLSEAWSPASTNIRHSSSGTNLLQGQYHITVSHAKHQF